MHMLQPYVHWYISIYHIFHSVSFYALTWDSYSMKRDKKAKYTSDHHWQRRDHGNWLPTTSPITLCVSLASLRRYLQNDLPTPMVGYVVIPNYVLTWRTASYLSLHVSQHGCTIRLLGRVIQHSKKAHKDEEAEEGRRGGENGRTKSGKNEDEPRKE